MLIFGNSRLGFSWIILLDCKEYGKNQYKKRELSQLSYDLNVTDPLIIPLIFMFLSWREKAHGYTLETYTIETNVSCTVFCLKYTSNWMLRF